MIRCTYNFYMYRNELDPRLDIGGARRWHYLSQLGEQAGRRLQVRLCQQVHNTNWPAGRPAGTVLYLGRTVMPAQYPDRIDGPGRWPQTLQLLSAMRSWPVWRFEYVHFRLSVSLPFFSPSGEGGSKTYPQSLLCFCFHPKEN